MQKIMSREDALEIIDQSDFGVLSLSDAEGHPYGVPLSMVRKGEWLYFHGRKGGRKMGIIGRGCRAGFTCVAALRVVPARFTTLFRSAIAEGGVELVEDRQEQVEALRLLSQKYAPEAMKYFDREIGKSLDRTAVFRMKLEMLTAKGSLEKKG